MTTDNPATGEHTAISTSPDRLTRMPLPHASKFRIALAGLVGIAVAAIAIAIVVATRGGNHNTVAAPGHWSSWAPDSSSSQGVSEIADYVAPYYRINASQQLDVVTPISVAQANASGGTTGNGMLVAVNEAPSGKVSNSSLALLNGKTVAYNICGLGPKDCELSGRPSVDRMLLLRREALELALYTFTYISGSQNVLAVLPPGRTVSSGSSASKNSVSSSSSSGKRVTVGILFVRKELQPWLKVPLSKTLQNFPPDVSELPIWSQSEEAGLVDQITARGLFSSQVEADQEGGKLLVLSPLPPQ